LRTGTHTVTVIVSSGTITVYVDAAQLLSYQPAAGLIPASAYAGFTAGSGMSTDLHAVSNVVIASGVGAAAPLSAGTTAVTFPSNPLLRHVAANVTLTNASSAPVVITGVTSPTAPYLASQLPVVGLLIPAGGSITVQIAYTPPATGTAPAGSLVVATTGGPVTVTLKAATGSTSGGTRGRLVTTKPKH
jgi:hypothetical protein